MRALPNKKRRLELYHADGAQVVNVTMEIIVQVGHYERNIAQEEGDEAEAVRWLHIENLAARLLKVARRAAHRYKRAKMIDG